MIIIIEHGRQKQWNTHGQKKRKERHCFGTTDMREKGEITVCRWRRSNTGHVNGLMLVCYCYWSCHWCLRVGSTVLSIDVILRSRLCFDSPVPSRVLPSIWYILFSFDDILVLLHWTRKRERERETWSRQGRRHRFAYRFFCKRMTRLRVGSPPPSPCRLPAWWLVEGGFDDVEDVDGDGRSELDKGGSL